MNKFIFTLLFIASLFTFNDISAQNLAFNDVLLVNTTEDTVPAGKVWKVQSVMPQTSFPRKLNTSSTASALTTAEDFVIIINGTNVYIGQASAGVTSGYTGGSGSQSVMYTCVNTGLFPMWLPEGTTLKASTNVSYISIVEFNVVP